MIAALLFSGLVLPHQGGRRAGCADICFPEQAVTAKSSIARASSKQSIPTRLRALRYNNSISRQPEILPRPNTVHRVDGARRLAASPVPSALYRRPVMRENRMSRDPWCFVTED